MIASNLEKVCQAIALSCDRRTDKTRQDEVKLIAVTKNHPIEAMREAIDAGVRDIGENRLQEAIVKYEVLDRRVKWHLLGHLQTNKVRPAVKIFDLIHSVDSVRLAEAIDKEAGKIGKIQNILVQLNLAREASKTGIHIEDLPELLTVINNSPNLCLQGFMFIAPNYDDVEECRPLFREMYRIYRKYQVELQGEDNADIRYLSMGMTHDYQIAIEEGANIVRVGTAVFGARQYRGQEE